MSRPVIMLEDEEIEVVGFAGAGGSCEGIKEVTGRSPAIVINHNETAIAVHTANHPDSLHICQNIYQAVPTDCLHQYRQLKGTVRLPKIGLFWGSPDCKHHSRAKGGKPLEKNLRDLAWVLVGWAKLPANQRPRIIVIENVVEWAEWGPLTKKNLPNKRLKGTHFWKFVKTIKRHGYPYFDYRIDISAANKGTPTTRVRLVAVFRTDAPVAWEEDTHGKPASPAVISGKRKPWRMAAECIDFSLPCPSIFDTSKQIMKKYGLRAQRPLVDNTLARIARGTSRYVVECADPFIVPITHTGDSRVHSVREPFRTLTCANRGEHALIAPLMCAHYGEGDGGLNRASSPGEPLRTVTCDPRHSVVTAFLANTRNGEREGQQPRCRSIKDPAPTVTAKGSQGAVVAAFLAKHYGDTGQRPGSKMSEPVDTITSCDHHALVSAGLVQLKGTDRRQSPITAPVPGLTAGGFHVGEVRAFITKFHRDGGQLQDCRDPLGTAGGKDRFGMVEVVAALPPFGPEHVAKARKVAKLLRKYGLWKGGEFVTIELAPGVTAVIVDLGMRMLVPEELKRAMGFRPDYIIDRGLYAEGWKPITKTAQVRLIGNAVCPQVAASVTRANYQPMMVDRRGIPEFALQAAE